MRKKSVLALLFAGGLLSSKHPALSADDRSTEGRKDNGVVQSVAEDSQLPPELRAYFLLKLVEGLIDRRSSIGEKKFEYKVLVSQSWWLSKKQTALRDFLQRVARSEQLEQKNPSSTPIPAATKKFAQSMITKALAELDSSSDDFCKLNFYFIASNQFKIFGDQSGYLKYKKIVDDAIHSCEADNSTANDNTILAAAAILDAMAYAIIPVNIPDRFDLKNSEKVDFTEQEYSEGRKLKQRSNAILDHLKSDNHNRRKAHRDLALWYLVLQKDQESEAEKKRQENWLARVRDEFKKRNYVHASEHFGFSEAGPISHGAPIAVPMTAESLRSGRVEPSANLQAAANRARYARSTHDRLRAAKTRDC